MLTKILKAVDIIGIPAILTFSGKEKSSSQFGGVCSLLFSLFAIWAVYNGARELFSLDNPQTVVSEVYSQDPREYIVSPSTFPLGFYVQGSAAIDYRYIIDPTIYTALVQLETFHMNGDYSLETLPTERCTQKHFGDMFSSFASAMELETSYCFAQDRISILGAYSSPTYQRILISVYQCNSTAVNNNCAPNDYVNAVLDGGWVNILYGNMVINPGNYDEPDQRYRDLFGTELSVTNSKGATIELRHLNVMTDSGWLVESWSREEFAKVNSISETSETRQLNDISTPLMSTGFEIGKLETNYSRSYKKIQEVLAEVAGLINTGLFCLLIATAGFFKLKVRETMMNELFDIDLDYKPPEKKDKNKANKNKKKNKKQQPQQTTPTEQMEDAKNDHSALRKLETDLSDHNRSKTPVIIRVEDSDKREDTPKAPRKNTRKLSANTAHKKGMEERKLIPPSRVMSHSYKDLAVMKSNLGVTQEESSSSFPTEELRRTKTPLRETHLFSEKEDPVKIELKILEEPEIDNYNPENSILMLDTLGNDTARGKEISTQEQRNNCELRINVERIEEGKLQEDIKGPEDGDGNNQSEESVHMLRKPKKIGISYWEYLLSFIYKPKRLRKKFRILDEGARNINMGLDVIHILKKMTELDKIKAILFNKDQLILFNNLPKPEIRPEDDALPGSQASLTRKLIRKANLAGEFGTQQEAINSYEFLKHKENKTEIDKKLIDIFYENLYGVQTEHS